MSTKWALVASWLITVGCVVTNFALAGVYVRKYEQARADVERLTDHIRYLERSAPKAVVDALNAPPGPSDGREFVYEPFKDATAPRIQPHIEPPF